MRISPYISAGRDLFKNWFLLNIYPQAKTGFIEEYKAGSGSWKIDESPLKLTTGNTINSSIGVYANFDEAEILTWDKETRVNFWIIFHYDSDQLIWIVSGDWKTGQYIGFKIIDDAVYGVCKKTGVEEQSILLQSIFPGLKLLSYVLIPNTRVQFFVNGVYKGELTSSVPTGIVCANYPVELYVKNTAASTKILDLYLLEFLQKK